MEIDATAFVASLDALVGALPAAVDAAGQMATRDAYDALMRDDSFQNRTYALRNAFSVAGAGEEWRVFIDPSASPRKGKTPPVEYGAYLNYGTSRIAPRMFLEGAADVMDWSAAPRAEQALSEWLNG